MIAVFWNVPPFPVSGRGPEGQQSGALLLTLDFMRLEEAPVPALSRPPPLQWGLIPWVGSVNWYLIIQLLSRWLWSSNWKNTNKSIQLKPLQFQVISELTALAQWQVCTLLEGDIHESFLDFKMLVSLTLIPELVGYPCLPYKKRTTEFCLGMWLIKKKRMCFSILGFPGCV